MQELLDVGLDFVRAGATSEANHPGAVKASVADFTPIATPGTIDYVWQSYPPGRSLAREAYQVTVTNKESDHLFPVPGLEGVSALTGVKVKVTSTQPGVDVVGTLRAIGPNFELEKVSIDGAGDVPAGGEATSSGTYIFEYDPANTTFDPNLVTFDITDVQRTAWFDAVARFEDMAQKAHVHGTEAFLNLPTFECPTEQNCKGAIMSQALAIAFSIWDGLIYADPAGWVAYTPPPGLTSTSVGEAIPPPPP
jgi:hypothetical protein